METTVALRSQISKRLLQCPLLKQHVQYHAVTNPEN